MGKENILKMNQHQLVGRKVKTLSDLGNSLAILPKGAICTIKYAHRGLELISDPCPCCGVSIVISGVKRNEVELIEE